MKVTDVMTPTVDVCAPDTTAAEIARKMREDDAGAIPVAENDQLIGMVTDRDIVLRAVANGDGCENTTAREMMSDGILYCFDDQSPREVLDNMSEQQVRRLPVVNRDKRLVGMVSLGDLSRHAPAQASGDALEGISRPQA